jgi:hypothetical protein
MLRGITFSEREAFHSSSPSDSYLQFYFTQITLYFIVPRLLVSVPSLKFTE